MVYRSKQNHMYKNTDITVSKISTKIRQNLSDLKSRRLISMQSLRFIVFVDPPAFIGLKFCVEAEKHSSLS